MAEQILGDQQQEAMECLYAIEAVAQLMQKANETFNDATSGMYGSAVIVERNAQRLMAMLGEG